MATKRPVGGLDHLTTVPENFDPEDPDAAGDRDGGDRDGGDRNGSDRNGDYRDDRLRNDGHWDAAGVGSDAGPRRAGTRGRRWRRDR